MVSDTVLTNGMTQKVEAWGMASWSGQHKTNARVCINQLLLYHCSESMMTCICILQTYNFQEIISTIFLAMHFKVKDPPLMLT